MSNSDSSRLHIAMFPWFAFGHFIPYLHLSNKLAEKGHKISFLLPKGAQTKLEAISHYPNLIQFFPLVVSHVNGIPPGSETASDVPPPLHNLLAIAFDQTRDQVEAILRAINPDMVFYDLGHWIPALARQIGFKSIYHAVVSATANAHITKKKTKGMTPSSVVFCAFGSQITLQKDEFQELVLGFELSGKPFLVALTPPDGCTTIEEALPEGFQERVQGRGLVHGGWVPQELLLSHPSVGCFVNHCGFGTMWESLLSDCQIVLFPRLGDQILNTRLMVEELKVAFEVERGENKRISKEHLSKSIKLVMDKDNDMAGLLKRNHAKLKKTLSNQDLQEEYINNFIQGLQDLIK
ncbi:hypothetical protein CRYUN_Cryun25bG0032200 [Craigia yunnanensis]